MKFTVKMLFFMATIFCSSSLWAKAFCLAHKGDHATLAENSLAAMKSAQALGADGVEIDLRHTRDGFAIVNHDVLLWRTAHSKPGKHCSRWTPISWQNLSDIRDNCELKLTEPIPTLEEVLFAFKDDKFILMLEFKDDPTPQTADAIYIHNRKDLLRGISHWDSALEAFFDLSTKKDYKIGLLKISKYWPRLRSQYGNALWWPFRKLLDFFPDTRKNETALFVVNTAENFKEAQALDVTFITTDDPHLCTQRY